MCLFLPLAACEAEYGEKTADDYDELMAEGVAALADADSATANDRFMRAQRVRGGDAAAGLGLALSDMQGLVELVDSLLGFLVDMTAPEAQVPAPVQASTNPGGLAPGSTLGDTLHHFIKHIMEPVLEEMVAGLDDARRDPDLVLDIPVVPIELLGEELLDMGGEWDAADVLWLSSLAYTMKGAVDFMQGINLDFDPGPLLAMNSVRKLLTGEPVDFDMLFVELTDVLLTILDDPEKEDLLSPLDGGLERIAQAQMELALAAKFGAATWRTAGRETDAQSDDVLGYVDANGNGVFDAGEVYVFLGGEYSAFMRDLLPAFETTLDALYLGLAEGTPVDPYPISPQTFDPAVFNEFLIIFGLPALVASAQWDLAAFFADPPLAEMKDLVADVLHCYADTDDPDEIFLCLSELF